MKFISICSGIEAASVAFAPLGWEAIAFSEIEPFPCRVLAEHYPQVPNFGDMTKFREWPKEIFAEADAIVGGPPCQAFSVAGLRNSLGDTRGNLTLLYSEIINHADEVRLEHGKPPVIVLYENVPGILKTHDNAFGCFLAGLAGESVPLVAPGGKWPNAGVIVGPQRTIAFRVLDAQWFGLAQRRKRVFVVASARDGFDPARVLLVEEGVRRDTPPSREEGQEVTGTVTAKFGKGSGSCAGGGHLRPCVTAFDTTQITSPTNRSNPQPGDPCHTLAKESHAPLVICLAHGQANAEITTDQAPTLNCNHEQPIAFVLTYALAGNTIGREPQNGGHQMGWNDSGVSYTLTKTDIHAVCAFHVNAQPDQVNFNEHTSATLTKSQNAGIQQGMQVRRLTPVECERLMGYQDNYTNIPKASNSARYKALGNSWAVPVVTWVGWRIWAELNT